MTTLQDIRKRQHELLLMAVGLLFVVVATTMLLASSLGERFLAVSLGLLTFLFGLYAFQNQSTIRSLSQQLTEESFATLEAHARSSVLSTKLKELTAMQTALEALATEPKPEKALNTILAAATELCGAARGSIMLLDEPGQRFVMAASKGLKPEYRNQPQRLHEGVAGRVVATGRPLLLNDRADAAHYDNFVQKEQFVRSSLCVPLRLNQRTIGVLNCSLVGTNARVFTEYDLQLMSFFAHYAVLVLERARIGRPHQPAA